MNYGKLIRFSPGTVRPRLVVAVRWGLAVALLLTTLPAGAAETLLSLGVLRDGKLDSRVSRAVHERLTRAGETAPATTHLTLPERQCAVPDCLDSLAGREKAQLVLSARIQQSSGFAYIAAFLYDVAHQRSMDVSAVCDKCLPEAQALRVGDLYARLLRDYRDRLAAEAAAPRRPVKVAASPAPGSPSATGAAAAQSRPANAAASPAAQALPTSPPDEEPAMAQRAAPPAASQPLAATTGPRSSARSFTLSPRRKLIAGILGGLGVATLAASIALTVTDGNATSLDCALGGAMAKICVLDNKVAYTLGYVVTSALAVGVGVTLFWPESAKSTRTEVNQ